MTYDPMSAIDSAVEYAESLAGMRAALTNHGFTHEQAADIIIAVMQHQAATEWQKARGIYKEPASPVTRGDERS